MGVEAVADIAGTRARALNITHKMANSQHWEQFYATHLPPVDFEDNRKLLKEFCERHDKLGCQIALVTSGGTTVPLEHNTVRFVDNFSAGTRGAASAEYFLDHGYAVVFMHRLKSLEPFTRHFTGQKFLDMLEMTDEETHHRAGEGVLSQQPPQHHPSIIVRPDSVDVLGPVLVRYKEAHEAGRLLYVTFTTVADYFWLLRAACECLARLESRALLYLAAAVSDFYVPSEEMPTHKMQSAEGAPTISLRLVPKMLAPLVSLWVPRAYVVSFKLETDENLLVNKARESLNKYKHKLVIANILQTRRQRVLLVTPDSSFELALTRDQVRNGAEIEEAIVSNVAASHAAFMAQC